VEWIEALRGATVGLDTAPLIYFIEEHPVYLPRLEPFFRAAGHGEFRVVTSLVTLLEVLVQPLRRGRQDLVREYREILLHSSDLIAMPLTAEIVEDAARIRADYNLRTPDAIQLATVRRSGASWFLTNDADLPPMPGISLLVVDRLPG